MKTSLIVTGMTCQNCVKHVTSAIRAVPGVTDVQVDLASGVAEVTGIADTSELIAAVQEEGYGVMQKDESLRTP